MNTPLDTLTQHLQHDNAGKVFAVAMGWTIGFFAPIQAFLITIFILVLADVVTGIWASMKRGEPFRASKLKNTVSKMVLYPVAVLISQVMVLTYFPSTPIISSLTYMVALFVSAVEFQSAVENVGDITGINLWGAVKDYFREKFNTKHT